LMPGFRLPSTHPDHVSRLVVVQSS
jgi:hypothetical protein